MKIVRLKTGARCVTMLDEQVIFVDPGLTREDIAVAVQLAMPDVHPDAISHWIEAAMPSTTPLSTYRPPRHERRAKTRPGTHRVVRTAGRMGQHVTTVALAAALGVVVAPIVHQEINPPAVAASEAWDNDVFKQVQLGSDWDCKGTDSSDLIATCVTPDGTVMHAEAWVGPSSFTFTFSYHLRGEDGIYRPHRNTLMVFGSSGAAQAWVNGTNNSRVFRNLIVSDRWVMYGSDPDRLERWAEGLGKDVVLPADVSAAAFEMGLLPSPEHTESNQREMAEVPKEVRVTAARILVGDASLPPSAEPPAGFPGVPVGSPKPLPKPYLPLPGATPDLPAPVPEPTPPAPAPGPTLPVQPAPTPPVLTPAPGPPAQEPAPVTPSPTPSPTPTPTPPAQAPAPVTPPPPVSGPVSPSPQPTPPASEPVAPAPGDQGPPSQAPQTPEQELTPAPGEDPDEAPVSGGDGAEGPPNGGQEGGEGAGPEPGPAQPDEEPAEDPLTGPIEVPQDEPTPEFDATAKAKQAPIFYEVAADMAQERSQAPAHAQGRPFAA